MFEFKRTTGPGSDLSSNTIYLIDWLEQINSRQSAGVHSDVSRDEAIQCIIHTYIALGDILRLKNDVEKGNQDTPRAMRSIISGTIMIL